MYITTAKGLAQTTPSGGLIFDAPDGRMNGVLVDVDGTVRAWDCVAEHYSLHTADAELTPAQRDEYAAAAKEARAAQ